MTAINRIFDFLFAVIAPLPQQYSLVLAAVLFGIVLVPIYGRVSPQSHIAKAKKRIFAALFESVIFRRSSSLSLKAQGKMGLNGLKYFFLAIPPILILALPCLLVLAQFNLLFGVKGLTPGQPTLVIARLVGAADLKQIALTSEPGVEISAPVRDVQGREIAWRLLVPESFVGAADGAEVQIKSGMNSLSLPLEIGESNHKVYPLDSVSYADNLVYPSGVALPAWIESLEIRYPERSISYGGFSTHWMVVFLVVSIVSGYIASKFFGVEV